MFRLTATIFVLLLGSAPVWADPWEQAHVELRGVLASLGEESFGNRSPGGGSRRSWQAIPESGRPALVAIGFAGGKEGEDSQVSGVVSLHNYLNHLSGEREDLVTLVFNHAAWLEAAERALELVEKSRRSGSINGFPQPLIFAYGHSLGGGAITQMARQLESSGVEISLAVFLDSFGMRNPRLSGNIRYAVNFYQRAGILSGHLLRGKKKLIPEDPEKTQILGAYNMKPQTDRFGWSWNLIQPLLYRQHHRMAHDVRFRDYFEGAIAGGLQLYQSAPEPAPETRPSDLFDRVVILGASVSAGEKAVSPGELLARHAGTPESEIFVFARGGAESDQLTGYLDGVAALKPSLVVALDLFYHDFKFSLFLTEGKKRYLRNYLRRLHDTGAVIVMGNIPSLVLLRYEHANRYFESLQEEFPNLLLLDVQSLLEEVEENGFRVEINREERVFGKSDLFADREHLNTLGSTLLANLILERLRNRLPDRVPSWIFPLDLAPYASAGRAR